MSDLDLLKYDQYPSDERFSVDIIISSVFRFDPYKENDDQ